MLNVTKNHPCNLPDRQIFKNCIGCRIVLYAMHPNKPRKPNYVWWHTAPPRHPLVESRYREPKWETSFHSALIDKSISKGP